MDRTGMVDVVKKSMGGTSPITSNPDKPDPLPGSLPTSLHPQAAKVRPSWQVSDVRGISTCLTMQSSRLKSDHFLVSLFSSSSLLLPSVRCPSKVVVLYFFLLVTSPYHMYRGSHIGISGQLGKSIYPLEYIYSIPYLHINAYVLIHHRRFYFPQTKGTRFIGID